MVIVSSGEARAAARPYARSAASPLERAWESSSFPALTLGMSISRVQGAAPTSSSQHLGEHWCHMLASLGTAECSGQFLARCPRTFHPMDELRRSQRRQHRTRGWLQGLHSCGARGASVQLEKTQPISSSSFQLDQVCSRNVRTQCLACTNGADLLVCVLGQAWSRGLLALLLSRCHPRLDWVRAPVELSHPLASELGGATCSRSSASGGATSGGAASGEQHVCRVPHPFALAAASLACGVSVGGGAALVALTTLAAATPATPHSLRRLHLPPPLLATAAALPCCAAATLAATATHAAPLPPLVPLQPRANRRASRAAREAAAKEQPKARARHAAGSWARRTPPHGRQ